MDLSVFSLRSILPPAFGGWPPKVFRIFGGCGTRPDGLVGAQTSSPSRYYPAYGGISGFPKIRKLLWLKSTFAAKTARSISCNKGFTLLEVMLAVVLMVSGFLSLSWAISTGLFAGGDNENTLTAINLAQEKMEEIRNKSYVNVVNEAKAAVSGFSSFQREAAVSTVQSGLKQVNVNVYWYAKSAETNVGLVSYVSDI